MVSQADCALGLYHMWFLRFRDTQYQPYLGSYRKSDTQREEEAGGEEGIKRRRQRGEEEKGNEKGKKRKRENRKEKRGYKPVVMYLMSSSLPSFVLKRPVVSIRVLSTITGAPLVLSFTHTLRLCTSGPTVAKFLCRQKAYINIIEYSMCVRINK